MVTYKNAKPLRKHLLHPLALTFFLLWLGTMVLLTSNACKKLEVDVELYTTNISKNLSRQYEIYQYNFNNDLGPLSDNILMNNLSDLAAWQMDKMDNGISLAVRSYYSGSYVRSQISWGYAEKSDNDTLESWYLYLDDGLDDAGQIALAEWMIANRMNGGAYRLYPIDDLFKDYGYADGRYARVTGMEQPGRRIDVQKIEIVYPDGTVETMVETATEGIGRTWEFEHININSVLLPTGRSSGKVDPISMERRLEAYRAAQEGMDIELGQSGISSGGFLQDKSGMYISIGSGDYDGKIEYGTFYYETLPTVLRQNIGLYISTAVLTLLVLLILSKNLSERVTFPVECLVWDIGRGKCRTDRDITELNTLAAAFNNAQEKVEQQLERERAFTRAAAHELKTPLAILRAHAECAMEDIAPEKRGDYLNIVLEESDRMSDLVGGLLTLARLDGDTAPTMEPTELAPIINEVLTAFAPLAEEKGITINSELTDLQVMGNAPLLHKAVSNLLSNGLRHTPTGGRVAVTLCEAEGCAVLTVDNDGSPIPDEHLPRLFEPFYRVDSARNRTDGGTGLGLTIVRGAVLAHGGSCEVYNRKGGVCFKITIPK